MMPAIKLRLLLVIFISVKCISQPSDFIVLKKHTHTIKNFFPGSHIAFESERTFHEGLITRIRSDTIFITEFDIRRLPSSLGVPMIDTIASYRLKFNYKEIARVMNQKERGFSKTGTGGSLLGGGILITAVGLGTWIFTKPGTQYYASPYIVAGGAAAAGLGYLLLSSSDDNYVIGKKYTIGYIKVK